MKPSIRQRLFQVEDQLCESLNELHYGPFLHTWNTLQQEIMEAVNAGELPEEDLALAHNVCLRIDTISKSVEDLWDFAGSMTHTFELELDQIFGHPNTGLPSPRSRACTEAPEIPILQPLAPFIQQSHAWLKKNLHNPYPSKEVLEEIAQTSGHDSRLINNWFIDVRKRLGWNHIRKTYFNNKLSTTIDAAIAFAQNKRSKLLTDPVLRGFTRMYSRIEELYAEKLVESELAKHIDNFVTAGAIKRPLSPRQDQQSQRYPTPETSPSSESIRSLPETTMTTRKRPRQCNGTKDEECIGNKRKRIRSEQPIFVEGSSSPSTVPLILPKPKRRRRVSQSDTHHTPKHPSWRVRASRLQTVSDPFPSSATSHLDAVAPHSPVSPRNLFENDLSRVSTSACHSRNSTTPTDYSDVNSTPQTITQLSSQESSFPSPDIHGSEASLLQGADVATYYAPQLMYNLPHSNSGDLEGNTPNMLTSTLIDIQASPLPLSTQDVTELWARLLEPSNQSMDPLIPLPFDQDVQSQSESMFELPADISFGLSQELDVGNPNPFNAPDFVFSHLFSGSFASNSDSDHVPLTTAANEAEMLRSAELQELKRKQDEIAQRIQLLEQRPSSILI